MLPLDLLKTVAIALVLLVMGLAGVVQLNSFDPLFKFASIIALGVVSVAGAVIFFYAALKSNA